MPLLTGQGTAITFFAPSDSAIQSFNRALKEAGAKLTISESK